MGKAYIEAGEFVTTHGIAGELKLYPWSDDAAFLAGFETVYLTGEGEKPLALERVRPHKNMAIVKITGVDSIRDARPYIGKTVYVAREDIHLPEGRYLVQDLLGARVVDDTTGRVYGTLVNVTSPGRHDVYEVRDEAGASHLFPATEPFLVSIDAAAGEVRVAPIPGMFDDGQESVAPEAPPEKGEA